MAPERPGLPQLSLFTAEQETAPFRVRESGRARRMSIRVHPRGRVEVVVPRRTRPAEVESFVRQHREWIDTTRREMLHRFPPVDVSLPRSLSLAALGREMPVDFRETESKGVRLRQQGGALRLSGAVGNEELCRDALRRWLATEARRSLVPRLRQLAEVQGLSYRRVQIRGQRTRWGSCSAKGTISLNYCLLFLESDLVDYLLIHELCHTRHLNHSRRYWALVERILPGYRKLDRRLGAAWAAVPGWVHGA